MYIPFGKGRVHSYASSGTTAAPSSVSVNHRGGWTLGGVRAVYMLYEHDGDQYVGRILSVMIMNLLSAKQVWRFCTAILLSWYFWRSQGSGYCEKNRWSGIKRYLLY